MWLRTLFSGLIAVSLHHVFLKHWSLSTKSEHLGSVTGILASDLKSPVFYPRQETSSSDTLLISSVPSHRFRKCMTKTNNYILPKLSFKSLLFLALDYINLITSLNLIKKIERKQLRRETCLHDTWEKQLITNFLSGSPPSACPPLDHSTVIFQIQNFDTFTIFHGFACDCLELWIIYTYIWYRLVTSRTLTVRTEDYLITAVAEALFLICSSWTKCVL